jgi:hypothetical protein
MHANNDGSSFGVGFTLSQSSVTKTLSISLSPPEFHLWDVAKEKQVVYDLEKLFHVTLPHRTWTVRPVQPMTPSVPVPVEPVDSFNLKLVELVEIAIKVFHASIG